MAAEQRAAATPGVTQDLGEELAGPGVAEERAACRSCAMRPMMHLAQDMPMLRRTASRLGREFGRPTLGELARWVQEFRLQCVADVLKAIGDADFAGISQITGRCRVRKFSWAAIVGTLARGRARLPARPGSGHSCRARARPYA